MPIYEYLCDACGGTHEALQKFSDDPLTVCPACGKPALKKKVSAAGFRLTGSGWYETDFKTGQKKNLAGDQPAAQESKPPAAEKSGGTSPAASTAD